MNNKVALITGSTSGIGRATAQLLLNKGYHVIISSNEEIEESQIVETF